MNQLGEPNLNDVLILAKEAGATIYRNRSLPTEPAVAFGNEAWGKFCTALTGTATATGEHGNADKGVYGPEYQGQNAIPQPVSTPESPEPLGFCMACGEGKIFPRVTTLTLIDGKKVPMLSQQCDHCMGIFAGHLETVANRAIINAVMPTSAEREAAFNKGWRLALEWAKREDLLADMDSPAYLKDRAEALTRRSE